MNRVVFAVKFIHSILFWLFTACVAYTVYAAISGALTALTTWVVAVVWVEGLVLLAFRWRCPLTILAERHGAARGSVTHLFFPDWLADRVFVVWGAAFVIANLVLLVRVLI